MAKPPDTPQFGMSRGQAAQHIGIGTALFDSLVLEGRMPRPRKIGTRLIWLRHEVEEAVESLPYSGDPAERRPDAANSWDVGIARRNGQSSA